MAASASRPGTPTPACRFTCLFCARELAYARFSRAMSRDTRYPDRPDTPWEVFLSEIPRGENRRIVCNSRRRDVVFVIFEDFLVWRRSRETRLVCLLLHEIGVSLDLSIVDLATIHKIYLLFFWYCDWKILNFGLEKLRLKNKDIWIIMVLGTFGLVALRNGDALSSFE